MKRKHLDRTRTNNHSDGEPMYYPNYTPSHNSSIYSASTAVSLSAKQRAPQDDAAAATLKKNIDRHIALVIAAEDEESVAPPPPDTTPPTPVATLVPAPAPQVEIMLRVQEEAVPVAAAPSKYGNYVIDPLTTILKLVILSTKPVGTKFCILNHILYIQERGIFQSWIRYFYVIDKTNIQYLYNPIYIASKKYLSGGDGCDNIIKIFKYAQQGLSNLLETYKDHIYITQLLNLYYNIIQSFLDTGKYDNFKTDELSADYEVAQYADASRRIWTSKKIETICNLIQYVESPNTETNHINIKLIEEFVKNVDVEWGVTTAAAVKP